ncbi:magnesium/cobalt transporter CorA [Halobacteriaceae archaeon GCM10025711]
MTVEILGYTTDGATRLDDVATASDADETIWVRLTEPTDDELSAVMDAFGVHHLSVEDVQNNVRPKVEEFPDHTFVLIKTAHLRRGDTTFDEELAEQPVGLFLGDGWLVTLTHEDVDAVDRPWQRLQTGDDRLLTRGPDHLVYRVADNVVDGYFGLLDGIESHIERIEDDVISDPDIETLEAINVARRDLLSVRKLLWPTREAVGTLWRGDPDQVQEATEKYFRDVYDHVVQLVDLAETYRELTAGARDIYLNSLSMSTNEVMKTLTVVATIVLPLTLVVGWFGMNFEGGPFNMPELHWTYGYPAAVVGMVGITLVLLVYFRREGWL